MEGLVTIASKFDPAETAARLEAELKARHLALFARVNHALLAAEAGLSLRPTEVFVFGNPRGGTPLMQASQTIGIDLPLKALVWQDAAGHTQFSYMEPQWLAQRHGLSGLEPVTGALGHALAAIAERVTGAT